MKICHVGLMSSGRMSCSSAAPVQSKKKPAAPSGLVIAFPYKVLWNVENFSVFYVLFIKLNCFYKILLWLLWNSCPKSCGPRCCIRLVSVMDCLYLNLDHVTSAFSLYHQHSSSSIQYLAHSHVISMSLSHKIFNFESKKFMSYSNECNKIILVNYNLPYIF
jgi:hypothetical protein